MGAPADGRPTYNHHAFLFSRVFRRLLELLPNTISTQEQNAQRAVVCYFDLGISKMPRKLWVFEFDLQRTDKALIRIYLSL